MSSSLQVEPMIPSIAQKFGFPRELWEDADAVVYVTDAWIVQNGISAVTRFIFAQNGDWVGDRSPNSLLYGWFRKCNNNKEVWKDLSVPEGAAPSFKECSECHKTEWPTSKYLSTRLCLVCANRHGFLTRQEALDMLTKKVKHKSHHERGVKLLWQS